MQKHGLKLMRKPKGEKEKQKTERNGGWGMQKVVKESELADYLAQSWRVITTLPSRNVVIER